MQFENTIQLLLFLSLILIHTANGEGCFSIDKWYGNDAWKIEKNVNSVLKCGYTCLKNRKKGCKQISWTGKLVFPERGPEYFADTKCYLYNKKKQLEPVKRKENVEFISTKTNIRKCYKLYNTNYKSKKRKSRKKGRRGGKSKGKRGFSMFKSGRVGGPPVSSNTDSQESIEKETSLLLDCLVKHRDFGSNFLKYIEDAKNNETCFSACKNDEACAGFAFAERGCYLYEEDKMENRDIPELYNVTSGAMKACLPNDTVADMWHVEEDDNDNNSTEFDDWDYEDFESREYTDMQENSANVTEGPGMKTVRTPAEKEHEDLALITENAGSPPEEVKKNIPPPEKNVNAAKVKQDEKSNPQKRKDSSPPKGSGK